ncbi:MAG: RNA 2'-phosphotransferase [Bacteroidales bacterium]|nr:RNA 2'-phosphotransferase [Bacteroidales bacterium]
MDINVYKQCDMSRSSTLAYYLRHDDTYDFDPKGWRSVENLCGDLGFSLEELVDIVKNDQKGRFELDEQMLRVRALYGHSVDVYPDLQVGIPPETLYHGTSLDRLDNILKEGLKPMSRKFVHLSADIDTALKVGMRHGTPVVLKLNTRYMAENGNAFYLSRSKKSEIWMVESVVLPEFLTLI